MKRTTQDSPARSTALARQYDQSYFQGAGSNSNYHDYIADSLGPSRLLGETLFDLFRPATALDMGCAVGHTVKRLRELGVEAYGYDISQWAVEHADAEYISTFDFSTTKIPRGFDLIYSYDVIEHVPLEQLEFAVQNLWTACTKDLVIVPALYAEGTASDPNEPTHEIFHDHDWWLDFFKACGCRYDERTSQRLTAQEHSKIFNYSGRIFVFSKLIAG